MPTLGQITPKGMQFYNYLLRGCVFEKKDLSSALF